MPSRYPVNSEVVCAERVARWRPLLNWLLIIPSSLWSATLGFGATVVVFVGWLAILFTGRLPERLGNYLVAVLRYQWRVSTYLYGLTDKHPGLRVVAGYVDPGDHPAVLYSARPLERRRLTVAFRGLLALPQLVVLYLVNLVALVVLVVGWFAVLATGRWPKGLQAFVIGWMRWTFRVSGYLYLLVDEYPPFGFQSQERPGSDDVISGAPPAGALEPRPTDAIDPTATTGPAWPRLIAADGNYSPPRLIRWPIFVGLIVFAGWVALVALRLSSTSTPSTSTTPYSLNATDAGFTATFPGQPQRTEKVVGSTRVILYLSTQADHVVGVTSIAVPPSATFSVDNAISGVAAGEQGGKVVTRSSVTYRGEHAEDGLISFSGGVAQVRVVVIGGSAYLLEGVGTSSSTYAQDYRVLLDTFAAG